MPLRRIVLTGFMGAGKSTLGPLLASRLGWRFIDADEALISREGSSIHQLFAQHGEKGFRLLEEQMVAELLTGDQVVVALGGGGLESAHTRETLAALADTSVVFLETPLAVALARCRAQAVGPVPLVRPILEDQGAIERRFTQRQEQYRRAHYTLPTADRTPSEIADQLLKSLGLC